MSVCPPAPILPLPTATVLSNWVYFSVMDNMKTEYLAECLSSDLAKGVKCKRVDKFDLQEIINMSIKLKGKLDS